MLGLAVGMDSVGIAVGWTDGGPTDGLWVGLRLGFTEVGVVGVLLGTDVGRSMGDIDGTFVGDADGVSVVPAVGSADTNTVGVAVVGMTPPIVGALLGICVGSVVGTIVLGGRVGALEGVSTHPPPQ